MKDRIFANHDHYPRTSAEKAVRDAWDNARMTAIESVSFFDLARVLTEIDNNFALALDHVVFMENHQPAA